MTIMMTNNNDNKIIEFPKVTRNTGNDTATDRFYENLEMIKQHQIKLNNLLARSIKGQNNADIN